MVFSLFSIITFTLPIGPINSIEVFTGFNPLFINFFSLFIQSQLFMLLIIILNNALVLYLFILFNCYNNCYFIWLIFNNWLIVIYFISMIEELLVLIPLYSLFYNYFYWNSYCFICYIIIRCMMFLLNYLFIGFMHQLYYRSFH